MKVKLKVTDSYLLKIAVHRKENYSVKKLIFREILENYTRKDWPVYLQAVGMQS